MAPPSSSTIDEKVKDKKHKSKPSTSKPSLMFSMFSSRKHGTSDNEKKKTSSSKDKKPASKPSSSKPPKPSSNFNEIKKPHSKVSGSKPSKSSALPSASFRDKSELLESKFFRDESHAPAKIPDTFEEFKTKNDAKPTSPKTAMPKSIDFSQFTTKYRELSKRQIPKKKKPSKLASELIPSSTMKYEDFKIKSKAPSHIKSVFVDPKDIEMASRQIKMTSLPPRERTKQEEWAQKMIQKVGNCPQDLPWNRIEEYNGYQCTGLGHFITDELIAEGKCGIMKTKSRDPRTLWGPYCPDPKNRKKFDFYDLREKPTYLAPDGWVMDEEPGDQEFWMRDDGSVFRSRMILDPNTLWYAIKYGEEPKVGGGEE